MERVRVVVHAGDSITRWGIAGHLRLRPEVVVVAEDVRAQVVVAADVGAAELLVLVQRFRVVVLVSDSPAPDLARVAAGVPCCNRPTPDLPPVAAVVPRTNLDCDHLVAAVLAAHAGRTPPPPGPPRLSARELDMLRLFAEGWTTADVAKKLSYSERTVKSVVQQVLNRFGLRNRTHAVAFAIRSGVI